MELKDSIQPDHLQVWPIFFAITGSLFFTCSMTRAVKMPRFGLPIILILIATLIAAGLGFWRKSRDAASAGFQSAVLAGCSAFENADAAAAIAAFSAAVKIDPNSTDTHLDLANAFLLASRSEEAIGQAVEALKISPNSAAALYVIGCANLRLGKGAESLKTLQQAQFIDPRISAVWFQLGRAHQALEQWEEAAGAFRKAISLEPEHAAAHYALSQALVHLSQTEAAQDELAIHQQILAKRPGLSRDPTYFEKCKYTACVRRIARLEQPAAAGVAVHFVDSTSSAFGDLSAGIHGPVGIIDLHHDGTVGLLVNGAGGFSLLLKEGGRFHAAGQTLPPTPGAHYTECLVGDLNNDGSDDFILLSDKGANCFLSDKLGGLKDVSAQSGLANLVAESGVLADLDFTGKLGLVAASEHGIRAFRNQGNAVFSDVTEVLGLKAEGARAHQLAIDDWNGDDLPDLFATLEKGSPILWLNQHGGPLRLADAIDERLTPASDVSAPLSNPAKPATAWPEGSVIAVGDLNNDLRSDLVTARPGAIEIAFNGSSERVRIPTGSFVVKKLLLVDYDNDGWLDIVASGAGVRVWRNLGTAGFRETTSEVGLDKLVSGVVETIAAVDLDAKGAPDLLVTTAEHGLQWLRNEGGNANLSLPVRLIGTRSNASGIGARIELIGNDWQASRTVNAVPIAIGTGRHAQIDSLAVHWSDLVMSLRSIKVDPKAPIEIRELELPTGSCPYLYVWDGERTRFVTDILGSAPAGLRVSEDRFVEADSEEIVDLGGDASVKPRDGSYTLDVTDELREVIYIDTAELIVVDHPEGTEVHSTSKLLPGKPFSPPQLVLLSNRRPLQQAIRSDGLDVSASLAENDGSLVSPIALRSPELRGLAEPFSVTLDFGPLPSDRPLVLALTGWLRFGGGMANVAASHDPKLPFPFPKLEVETAGAGWKPLDVVVGAPSGKTKTILVDLANKLPENARRLRLSTAFEIHWDRAALFERSPDSAMHTSRFLASAANLHWHGSSEYEDYPSFHPLTPNHERIQPRAPWLATPAGWCTRYGEVGELLASRDNVLVVMNCGDELTLHFEEARVGGKPAGSVRDFLFYSSGWDKDADYHVQAGLTVEPLPFIGMDGQQYGKQSRPAAAGSALQTKYNTRWVGPMTLQPASPSALNQ